MRRRKYEPKLLYSAWKNITLTPEIDLDDFLAGLVLPDTTPKFDLGSYPYQREILESVFSGRYKRITVMKSAQVGFTSCLMAICAYYIAKKPSSIMLAFNTGKIQTTNAKLRFQPFLDRTPMTKDLMQGDTVKAKDHTMLSKQFTNNAKLLIVNAGSADGLRSIPASILLADETSGWADTGAGNPISLFENRGISDPSSILVMGSTPLRHDENIHKYFKLGTAEYWNIKCGKCKKWERFTFEQFRFDEASVENDSIEVKYECPTCKDIISESGVNRLVSAGRFTATNDIVSKKMPSRSFHIWAGLNPSIKFEDIVHTFLEEKGGGTLQTFSNEHLGEPFSAITSKALTPEDLRELCKGDTYSLGIVPKTAAFLTAGIDVQKDVIFISVWAHCIAGEKYLIDYGEYPYGSTSLDTVVFEQLSKSYLLEEESMRLPIQASAIDSGFKTVEIYSLVRLPEAKSRHLYAVKGNAVQTRIFNKSGTTSDKYSGVFFNVGVNVLKSAFFGNLIGNRKYNKRLIRISEKVEDRFIKQICAEHETQIVRNGRVRFAFVRRPGGGGDNHYLDTTIYAEAAAHIRVGSRMSVGNIKAHDVIRMVGRQIRNYKSKDDYLERIKPELIKVENEFFNLVEDKMEMEAAGE